MFELPDRMTGQDLVRQERYEESIDKSLFDSMDKVDRRDKRGHIVSAISSSYARNYNNINWGTE